MGLTGRVGSGVRDQQLSFSLSVCLVSGEDLVDPAAELCDTGVDGGSRGGTTAASPGHNTNQSPDIVFLTDQGTARVALRTYQTFHTMYTYCYLFKLC